MGPTPPTGLRPQAVARGPPAQVRQDQPRRQGWNHLRGGEVPSCAVSDLRGCWRATSRVRERMEGMKEERGEGKFSGLSFLRWKTGIRTQNHLAG